MQNPEAVRRALNQTIPHQFFTDMQTARIPANGVTGVADVAASSNVVGMQNINGLSLPWLSEKVLDKKDYRNLNKLR